MKNIKNETFRINVKHKHIILPIADQNLTTRNVTEGFRFVAIWSAIFQEACE